MEEERPEVSAQLRGAVDGAVTGQGRLVLLAGEPGIGKTTQLGAAARHAAGRGVRTAWGWGSPADGAPAYWPWTQVLRDLDLEALPDAEDRFTLFDAVTSRLLAAARGRPALVLLDDLQWADVPSLLLLDFLARRLPSGALTVLGAYRDTGGVPDALAALAGRSTVIPLGGLPPDAVARVAGAILGAPPAPDLAERLHRRTGGNPFFVQQVAWLVKAGDDGVPPGVREALDQRFGHLDTTCSEALSAAAIAGRPFSVSLLAGVTGLPSGAVADVLADGVRGRVLVDTGAGYRFAHDLFREYAEDRLTPSGRAALHGRLGLALEAERERGGDVSLAELATHFARAGSDAARTLRYATGAAGEALRQLAYEEAVRHWERALDAAGPELARRRELLPELAATRWRAGDGPGAAHAYTMLADLARRGGDGPALARAALGLHGIGSRTTDLLTEALAGLGAADPLRSAVLAALARVLAWSGRDPTRAAALVHEAGELGLTGLATAGGTFHRDGPQWTISYGRVTVRARDAKGLGDLATLLAAPDRPVAAVDLAGRAEHRLGSDPVLDETARRQLRARIADLDEEIDEAERWYDPERADRARGERDALVAEVARAVGLGGRARRLGDESERARKAVTARIRDAIGRIEQVHPQLGAHLRASVTTGTYCVYSPATPTSWQI